MKRLDHITPPVIPGEPPAPPPPDPDVIPVRDPEPSPHPDPVREPPANLPPVSAEGAAPR